MSPMTDVSPIFALYVSAHRKAEHELSEAGIGTFTPTYMALRPTRQRWRGENLTETPLFQAYVFARIGPEDFPAVLACPHVLAVLRSPGGEPAPIPEEIITDLMVDMLKHRLNDKAPATKARPRVIRRRARQRLSKWIEHKHRAWYEAASKVTARAA